MNAMVSPVPSPEAVPAPAASIKPHCHALNVKLPSRAHRNHNLLLLRPPVKPLSPKQPEEEPPNRPLRSAEAPNRQRPARGRANSTTDVLRLMDALSLPFPLESYVSLVKECTASGDSGEAAELHRHFRRSGLRPSLCFLNRLLLMHVSCGCMGAARRLFDEMPHRNFLSWAVLLAAFAEEGSHDEAVRMFVGIRERFQSSEVPSWMVDCILKACVSSMNVEFGKQLHGWILRTGASTGKGKPSLSHLIGLHSAKIICSSEEKLLREAVGNIGEAGRKRIRVRIHMISNALKASCHLNDGGGCGKQIHANAIKVGVETCGLVQSWLVGMYTRNGLLTNARRVYDEMMAVNNKQHRALCSRSLIKGYLRDGRSVEAIKLLYEMKTEGIRCPDSLLDKVRILSGS